MINWKDIKDLHVISKLEQIINSWYGVELFYTDEHGKVQSSFLDEGTDYENHFVHVQMGNPVLRELLFEDISNVSELVSETDENFIVYDSTLPGVKGVAVKIMLDGEHCGTVFGGPFVKETITSPEIDKLVSFMVENKTTEDDAKNAVDKLWRLRPHQKMKLRHLLEFVSEEIVSFHQEIQKREDRINELNSEVGNKYRYHALIGKSKKMQQIYRLLEKVSPTDSTLLIQGENGTGKELVAKAVHYNSNRKDNIFLAVNCSAFNDNLLESELFGHVKGSFTGAVRDKKGLFEQANGGTLFMDEVGDTSPNMQVKLLRVLQEGSFLPVGANRPVKVNVRVICATNRNLQEMIRQGEFREDFYYRINVINVGLPPLRDRKDDIPLLTDQFLEKRCAEAGLPTKTLSKKCMEKMLDFNWPGNVRELQNEIERMVVLAGEDKTITPEFLSPRITEASSGSSAAHGVNTQGSLKKALEELEYLMIKEGLKRCNFNKSKLAKELGISRAGLIMKVDKYGLDKRKKAAGE